MQCRFPVRWLFILVFVLVLDGPLAASGRGGKIAQRDFGKSEPGITLSDSGTTENMVLANFIGTNAPGTTAIANAYSGIDISTPTQFTPTPLGINLVGGNENGYGVTANDPGDADTGPNQLQSFPVLTSAKSSGVVAGTLNSVANLPYRIDFYSSSTADPSGYGEGETWVGSTTVTTDGPSNANFNLHLSGSRTSRAKLTATATGTGSGGAGTSEFCAAITISP